MLNHATEPSLRNTLLSLVRGEVSVTLASGEQRNFRDFFSMKAGGKRRWCSTCTQGSDCCCSGSCQMSALQRCKAQEAYERFRPWSSRAAASCSCW